MSNTIKIGRKDVLWSYAATFLQIGAGVILLPFILRMFPQETVAIWTIFSTIIALGGLLDFGFNPSFARNVSYVVSGVKELKANGYTIVESHTSDIDYSLFKGLINAMKWFYTRVAAVLFVLLATAGTYYMHSVLKTYPGSHTEVYIAWVILVVINSYSLYTMYYDSLMQGKGLIKRSKQIQIAGQSIYLIVAIALILLRFNLIAVVSAQALSVIIRRILAYRTIYTPEFKQRLQSVKAQVRKEILKPIYPNAVKVGLASLGEFLVSRSALIIGGLFLSLHEVASYGLSLQIIMIIATISVVYFASYQPKIAQYKVHGNDHAIVLIYLKSCGMMLFAFITGGLGLFFWGDWALQIIKSQTSLLSSPFLAAMLVISFLDYNRGMAGWVLVSGNSVPFFKSNLITAGTNLCLLFIFLQYTNAGIWGLILAQGTTQGIYQNWKWPIKVVKELHIKKIVTIYLKNVFMNKAILKKVTPGFVLFLWRKYNNNKEGRKREIMRTQIVNYLENIHPNGMTDEKQVVLDFLKCHSLSYFPYSYTEKYNPKDIVVYTDKERKMHYVLHDNKRLYFKRSYDKDTVKECYKNLLMEQDMASPHRYENADFRVHEGDVVADAGAAEGIFALSVVERAKELYLFEADKEWIAPLEATFTPFGDKVHIVNSYVSDKWIGCKIALDKFFEHKKVDFIKADIEGAELQLLGGAEEILQQPGLKLALCTYHYHDDAKLLKEKLLNAGFQVEFSKGYCFLHLDVLSPPYLRRGVIRAKK